jgi:hypothetical protein
MRAAIIAATASVLGLSRPLHRPTCDPPPGGSHLRARFGLSTVTPHLRRHATTLSVAAHSLIPLCRNRRSSVNKRNVAETALLLRSAPDSSEENIAATAALTMEWKDEVPRAPVPCPRLHAAQQFGITRKG